MGDVWSACPQISDEEAAKEEEAEALRLQRKEAEALRPEDFEQPSEPESEDDEEEADGDAGTLGAAADRVRTNAVSQHDRDGHAHSAADPASRLMACMQ